MMQPELNTKEDYWFLLRFFYRAYNYVNTVCTWLFVQQFQLPDDASGELMRRALAKKSWFDDLSSGWVEKSFWTKLQIVLGSSLVAGVVGIFVGASLLLSLTTLFFMISAHVLLVSHEHHRYQTVKLMAQETIELNQDLVKEQQSLAKNAQVVKDTAEKLTKKNDRLQIHLERLEQTVAEVTDRKSRLEVQEGELQEAEQRLDETEQNSEYIKKVQESLKTDALYLQKHSVFMEQQKIREKSQKPHTSIDLDELDAELEDGKRLMEEIKNGIKLR